MVRVRDGADNVVGAGGVGPLSSGWIYCYRCVISGLDGNILDDEYEDDGYSVGVGWKFMLEGGDGLLTAGDFFAVLLMA